MQEVDVVFEALFLFCRSVGVFSLDRVSYVGDGRCGGCIDVGVEEKCFVQRLVMLLALVPFSFVFDCSDFIVKVKFRIIRFTILF